MTTSLRFHVNTCCTFLFIFISKLFASFWKLRCPDHSDKLINIANMLECQSAATTTLLRTFGIISTFWNSLFGMSNWTYDVWSANLKQVLFQLPPSVKKITLRSPFDIEIDGLKLLSCWRSIVIFVFYSSSVRHHWIPHVYSIKTLGWFKE